MAVAAPAPQLVVDLVHNPVVSPDHADRARRVDACQRQLADAGACELPGFLTTAAVERLAREATTLAPLAQRSRVEDTCYLDFPDESFPAAT